MTLLRYMPSCCLLSCNTTNKIAANLGRGADKGSQVIPAGRCSQSVPCVQGQQGALCPHLNWTVEIIKENGLKLVR